MNGVCMFFWGSFLTQMRIGRRKTSAMKRRHLVLSFRCAKGKHDCSARCDDRASIESSQRKRRRRLSVCVNFFELNVVILPKVLNPRTLLRVMGVVKSIDWDDCSLVMREKLQFYIEQSNIDHKCCYFWTQLCLRINIGSFYWNFSVAMVHLELL